MTSALPPVDAHAHVETSVAEADLMNLRAFVMAVTRQPSEWDRALGRTDEMAIWGLGVHPGVVAAFEEFDPEQFETKAARALLIGEVGLDGRSKVSMDRQIEVFDAILEIASRVPRPISIHSVRATAEVLAALRRRPVPAAILHWWRGTASETAEAVALGCFFSLNGAETRDERVLKLLPTDRVLTETDFPHTRRSDPKADRPAAVVTIESALASAWGLSASEVRTRIWRTLSSLLAEAEIEDRLPGRVQDCLLAAGT